MGVRPPQRGDDEEPETVAFGIAALDEHLGRADVTFPATDEEVLTALGDPAVPVDASGTEMRLSTALSECRADRFETRQDLLNELHPVFEARRARANRTLVGRLRSILPF